MSSILDKNKLDIVIPKDDNNFTVLIIADHLDWKETKKHLQLLQDKINLYLSYIESGEIYEKYPESKNLEKKIRVVGQYPLNEEAYKFYDISKKIIRKAGFYLEFNLYTKSK
jgi:hypothetical protein